MQLKSIVKRSIPSNLNKKFAEYTREQREQAKMDPIIITTHVSTQTRAHIRPQTGNTEPQQESQTLCQANDQHPHQNNNESGASFPPLDMHEFLTQIMNLTIQNSRDAFASKNQLDGKLEDTLEMLKAKWVRRVQECEEQWGNEAKHAAEVEVEQEREAFSLFPMKRPGEACPNDIVLANKKQKLPFALMPLRCDIPLTAWGMHPTSSNSVIPQMDGAGDGATDGMSQGVKREREDEKHGDGGGDAADDEALNSEDDDLGDDDLVDADGDDVDADNLLLAQFEKVIKKQDKWKVHLRDCVAIISRRDYLFRTMLCEFEW